MTYLARHLRHAEQKIQRAEEPAKCRRFFHIEDLTGDTMTVIVFIVVPGDMNLIGHLPLGRWPLSIDREITFSRRTYVTHLELR